MSSHESTRTSGRSGNKVTFKFVTEENWNLPNRLSSASETSEIKKHLLNSSCDVDEREVPAVSSTSAVPFFRETPFKVYYLGKFPLIRCQDSEYLNEVGDMLVSMMKKGKIPYPREY